MSHYIMHYNICNGNALYILRKFIVMHVTITISIYTVLCHYRILCMLCSTLYVHIEWFTEFIGGVTKKTYSYIWLESRLLCHVQDKYKTKTIPENELRPHLKMTGVKSRSRQRKWKSSLKTINSFSRPSLVGLTHELCQWLGHIS